MGRRGSLPYVARRVWPAGGDDAGPPRAVCVVMQCSIDRFDKLARQLCGWTSEAAVAIYIDAPP
eukprot:218765-Alexandrium_andersonii.AAC.1